MGQMTWRAPDDLIERIRDVAADAGRSMNDYVTAVLDAATDPALAGDEPRQVRERLARSKLIAPQGKPRKRPPSDRIDAARKAASSGTRLADLVADSR